MFKNLSTTRRRTLLWLLLAVVTLSVLAGGLGSFTFQPGKNFSRNSFQLDTPSAPAAVGSDTSELFQIVLRGILAVALILLPISLISALMTPEGRRRLLTNLIMIGLLLFLADRVQKSPLREAEQVGAPIEMGAPKVEGEGGEALPPLPTAPSETFVTITSILVVLAGVSLALWLGRGILFPRNLKPLDQIGREAEQARSDLAGGALVEDVVIRCYRQMSRVAQEGRKIQRAESVTPHEFKDTLTKAGLPAAPVQALTQIFEDVRYGGLTPGPAERQAAIDSLSAIAAACRTDKD